MKLKKMNIPFACFTLFAVAIVAIGIERSSVAAAAETAGAENSVDYWDYSTPPGITLVEITQDVGDGDSPPEYYGIRIGDSAGNTLFVYDEDAPGKSNCSDDCALDFPPVLALPDAWAYGDWSLVPRDDDNLQWAYQGNPLYTFAKETRLNEAIDNILAKKYPSPRQFGRGTEDDGLTLPEGWSVAEFAPAEGIQMPATIGVEDIATASSSAFVDPEGMSIYAYGADIAAAERAECSGGQCSRQWMPVAAAELSNAIGDFVPVQRSDGSKQWTYKGSPLYTFAGDLIPGHINGLKGGDPQWAIAALRENFKPQNVEFRESKVRGAIIATTDGMPLYARYPFEYVWGGRTTYRNDVAYTTGKYFGTNGCDDKCLETWHPFIAPDDATPSGFWEIVERDDGGRQWAYKGFVLYTYAKDEPFGVVTGSNRYEYVVGDGGRYTVAETKGKESFQYGGASGTTGFYWRVGSP